MLDVRDLAYDMGYKEGLELGDRSSCPVDFRSDFYLPWLNGFRDGLSKVSPKVVGGAKENE